MEKIIKSKGASIKKQSVETVEYIPLEGKQSLPAILERMAGLEQQMERDGKSFVLCSMIYAMKSLDAAEIKENAFQVGYAEGKEEAARELQIMLESQASLHRALENGIQELASFKDAILNQAESDIIKLVISLATKLMCREFQQHPDTIVAVAKQAIKVAKAGEDITIRIHPDDYATLEQHVGELKQSLEDIGRDDVSIQIEAATELAPGGCTVETDTNLIDMSLEQRMESLFSMLNAEC